MNLKVLISQNPQFFDKEDCTTMHPSYLGIFL